MKHAIWLVGLLTLALAGAACGDDSDTGGDTGGTGGSSATGGTGGSSATGGTGGTGGSSATGGTGGTGGGSAGAGCEAICNSSCIGEIADEDVESCLEGCAIVFEGCESETVSLLNCLDSVDCDENAAEDQCQSEALDWGQCIGGISF
ncbi:MAG: hypothetical protein AAGF92_16320 [Myxococcota bacterium]